MVVSFVIIGKIVRVQHFNNHISTSSQPKYFNVKAPRGNIIADDGSAYTNDLIEYYSTKKNNR